MLYYTVERGFVNPVREAWGFVVDDNPTVWEFESKDEAKAFFRDVKAELPRDFRVEGQCSNLPPSLWKDAYCRLNSYEETDFDEDGEALGAELVEVIDEARYGEAEYVRDHE